MSMIRFALAISACWMSLGLLVGCGGDSSPRDAGKVVLKGKLVENGKPYVVDASKMKLPPGATAMPPGTSTDSLLAITFTPAEGGEVITAKTDANAGTFELTGADGKGLKPGRYKVTITGGYGQGSPDLFNNRFAPGKSQLVVDVETGKEIVIDVAKP